MSPRDKPHSYDARIMLETSALVAGWGTRPSDEDLARRPDVLRLVEEARERGSTIQVATASYLELGWKGIPPDFVNGFELLAFDAQAARALARLSTLSKIAQAAGGKKLVKFDAMVLASAVWRSDVVVAYDGLFLDLIEAFGKARAQDPRFLPERLPRVKKAHELLPGQQPLTEEAVQTAVSKVPEAATTPAKPATGTTRMTESTATTRAADKLGLPPGQQPRMTAAAERPQKAQGDGNKSA